jgi:hypothetical protein
MVISSRGIFKETDLQEMEMQEAPLLSCESEVADKGFWTNLKDAVHQFIEELMAPPTISAVCYYVSVSAFLASHFTVARSWKDQI